MASFLLKFGSTILIVYYGILPLFKIEVFIRNTGFVLLDSKQAIINILIGMAIIFLASRYKSKHPEYTKCPKCKETFKYNDLDNGKCPNCKDIDTIDLDEYFKKYPKEKLAYENEL